MYCDQWTRSCASSSARMCFPIDARICRLVAPTPISKSAINKKAERSFVRTLVRICATCRTSQPSGKRPSRNESKAPGCSVSEVGPGFEGDCVTRRLPLDVHHTHSRPNSSLKHERHEPLGPRMYAGFSRGNWRAISQPGVPFDPDRGEGQVPRQDEPETADEPTHAVHLLPLSVSSRNTTSCLTAAR